MENEGPAKSDTYAHHYFKWRAKKWVYFRAAGKRCQMMFFMFISTTLILKISNKYRHQLNQWDCEFKINKYWWWWINVIWVVIKEWCSCVLFSISADTSCQCHGNGNELPPITSYLICATAHICRMLPSSQSDTPTLWTWICEFFSTF